VKKSFAAAHNCPSLGQGEGRSRAEVPGAATPGRSP
jgi:hypothetical protein